VRLRAVGRTAHGRRITVTRTYHPCTRLVPERGTGGPR
jgi:hypothetical protein